MQALLLADGGAENSGLGCGDIFDEHQAWRTPSIRRSDATMYEFLSLSRKITNAGYSAAVDSLPNMFLFAHLFLRPGVASSVGMVMGVIM